MRIDILSVVPELLESPLGHSIVGRAIKKGLVEIHVHNLRKYGIGPRKNVDDYSYGGDAGMVMMVEPVYRMIEELKAERQYDEVIYMSPDGEILDQGISNELSLKENLIILCGHYEGVDERVIEEIVDEEISIGDYVLTGGELPALVLVDSVVRMLEGTLSKADCYEDESHYNGLLEYPQYTRPEIWHDKQVPEVLLSGHHANIQKWRHEQALLTTKKKRPELLEKLELTPDDLAILHKIGEE